jgi:hypothetical protein
MKGLISLAATFAILLIACGKEPIPEYRIVYYPNKKNVKEEWSIIRTPRGDTLEQGVHKQYFWNGTTASSEVWKKGLRDGSAQAWYENGTVKWQKSYAEGKRQGTWRLSYKDGHPWMVVGYDKDVLNGKAQVWGKDDATESKEAEFKAGNCVSGECALLEPAPAPVDTSAAAQVEAARSREIVSGFLK